MCNMSPLVPEEELHALRKFKVGKKPFKLAINEVLDNADGKVVSLSTERLKEPLSASSPFTWLDLIASKVAELSPSFRPSSLTKVEVHPSDLLLRDSTSLRLECSSGDTLIFTVRVVYVVDKDGTFRRLSDFTRKSFRDAFTLGLSSWRKKMKEGGEEGEVLKVDGQLYPYFNSFLRSVLGCHPSTPLGLKMLEKVAPLKTSTLNGAPELQDAFMKTLWISFCEKNGISASKMQKLEAYKVQHFNQKLQNSQNSSDEMVEKEVFLLPAIEESLTFEDMSSDICADQENDGKNFFAYQVRKESHLLGLSGGEERRLKVQENSILKVLCGGNDLASCFRMKDDEGFRTLLLKVEVVKCPERSESQIASSEVRDERGGGGWLRREMSSEDSSSEEDEEGKVSQKEPGEDFKQIDLTMCDSDEEGMERGTGGISYADAGTTGWILLARIPMSIAALDRIQKDDTSKIPIAFCRPFLAEGFEKTGHLLINPRRVSGQLLPSELDDNMKVPPPPPPPQECFEFETLEEADWVAKAWGDVDFSGRSPRQREGFMLRAAPGKPVLNSFLSSKEEYGRVVLSETVQLITPEFETLVLGKGGEEDGSGGDKAWKFKVRILQLDPEFSGQEEGRDNSAVLSIGLTGCSKTSGKSKTCGCSSQLGKGCFASGGFESTGSVCRAQDRRGSSNFRPVYQRAAFGPGMRYGVGDEITCIYRRSGRNCRVGFGRKGKLLQDYQGRVVAFELKGDTDCQIRPAISLKGLGRVEIIWGEVGALREPSPLGNSNLSSSKLDSTTGSSGGSKGANEMQAKGEEEEGGRDWIRSASSGLQSRRKGIKVVKRELTKKGTHLSSSQSPSIDFSAISLGRASSWVVPADQRRPEDGSWKGLPIVSMEPFQFPGVAKPTAQSLNSCLTQQFGHREEKSVGLVFKEGFSLSTEQTPQYEEAQKTEPCESASFQLQKNVEDHSANPCSPQLSRERGREDTLQVVVPLMQCEAVEEVGGAEQRESKKWRLYQELLEAGREWRDARSDDECVAMGTEGREGMSVSHVKRQRMSSVSSFHLSSNSSSSSSKSCGALRRSCGVSSIAYVNSSVPSERVLVGAAEVKPVHIEHPLSLTDVGEGGREMEGGGRRGLGPEKVSCLVEAEIRALKPEWSAWGKEVGERLEEHEVCGLVLDELSEEELKELAGSSKIGRIKILKMALDNVKKMMG